MRQPVVLADARRAYDKAKYRREKALIRKRLNQDDVDFGVAFSLFQTYALGQDLPVKAYIKLPTPESGSRPLRGEVTLPNQVGDRVKSRILVFATGEHAEEAKRLGADIVGGDELIQQILEDRITFDRCLSTKAMFPKVIKIAKKLGPKGLMPSPAKGTVSDDLAAMMASLQASTKYEPDSTGMVVIEIGKSSWSHDKIKDNLKALVSSIVKIRPSKQDASRFVEGISISAPHTIGMTLPLRQFVPRPPRQLNEVQALLASYGLRK
ncbi:hypothetical protein HK105_200950 [Polyrhizophydium stewartii]|uniref:Ribosomal protein n=1 Tax=Polyrhizophydium stewartii TaxID=2732419 RepID=A0ABR4NIF8_9FUNG